MHDPETEGLERLMAALNRQDRYVRAERFWEQTGHGLAELFEARMDLQRHGEYPPEPDEL